ALPAPIMSLFPYTTLFRSGNFSCHFHALWIIASSDWNCGRQPSSFFIFSEDAISRGGSPGRRGLSIVAIFRPVILAQASITSRTLEPPPVPRLQHALPGAL